MEFQENIAPLERSSLRDGATRSLRQQIVAGTLEPDRLYSIGEIATKLGTSPTPIREALLELESNGLVELVRNRGFRIKEITVMDMQDIHAIRVMLEVPALQKLAGFSPMPDLSEAEIWCEKCSEAAAKGDIIGFLAFDRDFHLAMIGQLKNRRLTDMVGNLRDQTRLYGLEHLEDGGLEASAGEHPPLLEAVRSRNAKLVGRLLKTHLGHIVGDWATGATD